MMRYLYRYRLLTVIYGLAMIAAVYESGYLERPTATIAGLAQPSPASDVLIGLYPDSPMAKCFRADQAMFLTYDLPTAKRLLGEALSGGYKGEESYFYNYATVLMLLKEDRQAVDEAVADWRRHDLTTNDQLDPRAAYRNLELPAPLDPTTIRCLVSSSDGTKLVFARQDNRLWLAEPGPNLERQGLYGVRQLPGRAHQNMISALALAANETQVVSASLDGDLAVWDLATAGLVTRLPAQRVPGQRSEIYDMAVFPDGFQCAVVDRAGMVRIWDLRKPVLLREFQGAQRPLSAVAVSPDGTMLATGGWSGVIKLWDLNNEQALPRSLEGHRGVVNRLVFASDGKVLASCSRDSTARIWNLQSGKSRVLKGHGAPVYGLDLSPDGNSIVTAAEDRRVKIWNMQDGKLLYNLATRPTPRPLYAVLFAPDSRGLIWAGGPSGIQLIRP